MTKKSSPDHREAVCDAAISILAAKGVAGLSPRAVDRHLGLATGTTASYFRTRMDLVQGAAERMLLLDGIEASSFRASAVGIAAVLERSLDDTRRERLIARFELFLLAARSPQFATMRWARELFLAGTEAQLRIANVRAPKLAAIGVVALVEGLLVHSMLVSGLRRRDLIALLRSMFSGFFDRPLPDSPERL